MRVPQFLQEHHVVFETIAHPPAFTSQHRAKHLHVTGKQVTKAVLLAGPQGRFLGVLPATHHIDTKALAAIMGGPVRLATEEEIAQVFDDCEPGVVEPLGMLYGLPTILDESIPSDSWIIFESHTHGEAIRMLCRDFERVEQPRRLRFARR